MMKIEPLPLDVRSYLRSGVAITSVTQCVEELVLNSLDARATCVAVRIDLNCFKIQVVDNGSGAPKDQLEMLGNRFCTSKCHAIEDLDNLCHFGYRGEALASIRDSCGILEITTRSKLSSKTYCKIFQNGKNLKVAESTIVRPSIGTTITVHELFSNFPVRQKSMNKNLEMERIKEMLEGVSLIRPELSFTLRNDTTGQMILSTRKCASVNSRFGQLYSSTKSNMLVEVRGSKQMFHVHGYIGREGHQRKNLQFIYVNGRIVKKSKIHKLLNKLLLNLPALKPKQRAPSDSPQMPGNKQNLFSSPPKFSEVYPVYVLEIKCPISEYDITFEPAKTMVEFKDWNLLLECIEEITVSFLDKENIVVKTNEVENRNSETVPVAGIEKQELPVITADNMKDMLSSKIVTKSTSKATTIVVMKDTDDRHSSEVTTTQTSESTDSFKTPNTKFTIKNVNGLGNRKIGIETDTESEMETTTEITDTSSAEESFNNETLKSLQNKQYQQHSMQTNSVAGIEKLNRLSGFKETNESSLSVFRQSIGKLAGKTSKKVNIDESMKKLDRIIPSSIKSNSKTFFSSLQKFRRNVGSRNTVTETEINQGEEEMPRSSGEILAIEEKIANALYRDDTETMSKAYDKIDISRPKRNSSHVFQSNISEEQGADYIRRNADGRNVSSLSNREIEPSNLNQDDQFKFFPCYDIMKDDSQKSDNAIDSEDEPVVHASEVQDERRHFQHNGSSIPEKMGNTYDLQNVKGPTSCFPESDQRYTSDTDIKCTKSERKRPCLDSASPAPEKQFKYSAKPLEFEKMNVELTYNQANCDRIGNMCNETNCDNVDVNNKNIQTSVKENNLDVCDHTVEDEIRNDLPHSLSTDLNGGHSCTEGIDIKVVKGVNESACYDSVTRRDGVLEINEVDCFTTSTQAFSPRLSPPANECKESNTSNHKSDTPESMGFTPKNIVEANTPCSVGFFPSQSFESSSEQINECIEKKEENSCKGLINDSEQDAEINCIPINSEEEDFEEEKEISSDKCMFQGQEDKTRVGTDNGSVTISQLLNISAQQIESGAISDRNESSRETDTSIPVTEVIVAKRKGFSFADLFSQTPTCSSINADTEMNPGQINSDNGHNQLSKPCSDYELSTVNISTDNNNTVDVDDADRVSKVIPEEVEVMKPEDNDSLWSDSPWDISDSSFYLRDVLKQKENNVPNPSDIKQEKNETGEHEDGEESAKFDNEDTEKDSDDDTVFDDQNLGVVDSLNAWYNKLDVIKTGTSDVLQSNKPSDVVRKLHACRFSKESLKSVKVLGQLDKKFIACLMNTEQGSNIDMTMLVLVDQHAAHERIRLEILTEDAFESRVKGGQLAPFAVDPPQSMAFAEHEVRTILSFLDGYQNLGIKMKKDTATSMLIYSVPACLVDREKNNKIYWSTIQVLIREHIAVFMSTQVSCGVLPQTIHKVLCSLACHGAIKFGDKLSADECDRLVKDLSRCDLPFQCAHGRPSVTPLFQIDKLQSLSSSKHQAKPKLWKLKQAMNMKSK